MTVSRLLLQQSRRFTSLRTRLFTSVHQHRLSESTSRISASVRTPDQSPRLFFSSQPARGTNESHYEHYNHQFWTQHVLEPKWVPLGSMTVSDWKETMQAMVAWLQPQQNGHRKLQGVTPHAVDSVDRLLKRLLDEHKTQSSASMLVAGKPDTQNALTPWVVAVLQAWLQICEEYPLSSLGVEKADGLWKELVRQDETEYHSAEYVALIQSWISIQQPRGVKRAIELLTSNNDEALTILNSKGKDAELLTESLIECHHSALLQCMEFVFSPLSDDQHASLSSDASMLMEHMQQLADDVGLTELQPNQEEISKVFAAYDGDKKSLREDAMNTGKSLSSFESKAMQRRILKGIEEASLPQDREHVEQLIQHYNKLTGTNVDAAALIAKAAFEFYVRTKDPQTAMYWMHQLDRAVDSLKGNEASDGWDRDEILKKRIELLKLWVRVAHQDFAIGTENQSSILSEAPWRAEELLVKIEEYHRQYGNTEVINESTLSEIYFDVASLWQKSRDGRAVKKVISIMHKVQGFSPQLLFIALKTVEEGLQSQPVVSIASVNAAEDALRMFSEHFDDLPSDDRNEYVECAAKILALARLPSDALGFLDFLLVQKGFRPSIAICEYLLNSFPGSTEESASAPALQQATPSDMIRFLQLLTDHDYELEPKQYTRPIEFLTQTRHEASAGVVKNMFRSLLREGQKEHNPLLNDVLEKVLEFYVEIGQHEDAAEIIETLQKVRANASFQDYNQIKPASDIILNIMRGISRADNKDKESAARQAIRLLKFMKTHGVDPGSTEVFNTAMEIVLKADGKKLNQFRTILNIIEKIMGNEENPIEPDADSLRSMLIACRRARGADAEKAIYCASDALERIRSMGEADQNTYSLFFLALKHKLSSVFNKSYVVADENTRQHADTIVSISFENCCRDNLVSETVLAIMEELVSLEKLGLRQAKILLENHRNSSPESKTPTASPV